MRNARPAARPYFVIALVFLLGGLTYGLNAAPAVPTPPPASVPALPPVLLGKIAHIRIVGTKNIPADAIRAVLTSKVGDLYSPVAAERDRAAVTDMDVFNGPVVLSAAPNPAGGVDLTYAVAENPVVKNIRFTANTPTKEPTIPAATLIALMKTRVGQVLNTKILVSDLNALFNHDTGYVSKQGYIFDVSADINIDPPTGVLAIPLVEAHVQSIQTTGNSRVKTADILAQMHTKVGDIYKTSVVEKDYGAVYEMGDFKQVGPATLNGGAPGQVTLTLPVVEREAARLDKLDEKQGKVVPLLYDPVITPFPVIQVSINGKPPLPFIVDTGTSAPLTLDPWVVAKLGLKKQELTGKGEGFRYAKTPIRSAVFQGTDRANDVTFNIDQAIILDLGFMIDAVQGGRVAGIVGLGMLRPVTTRFDFAAKTLTLFAYSHPPLLLPGATVLPLRPTSGGLFTVHVTFSPEADTDLPLDTGSTGLAVPLADLDALHPTATTYGMFVEQIGNLYVCPALRLPGLTLGPLRVPNVEAVTVPPGGRMALGLDILAGYRLTLDGPNAQLTLEPSAEGGRYARGYSGLDLKRAGEGWSVSSVKGASPARQAGVRVGDNVLTVNGRSVQGLSLMQAGLLISGLAGRPVLVSLRRGQDKARSISWVPLDVFSAPRDALDGLTLRKPTDGPWIIVNILPDCPGSRVGLQVGDEITQMDGVPTANMPLDQLAKIMGGASKSIALLVQRTGRAAPLSVKLIAPP